MNFVGGHPMAGVEQKSIDYSTESLFDGAKWVLTPSKCSDKNAVLKLEELINILGAKAITADPYGA